MSGSTVTKSCTICQEKKSLDAYNTRPDRKSGYRSECKPCQYQRQALRSRIIPGVISRARANLHYAVKTGKVIKPEQCESCELPVDVHAHHEDYLCPLDVNWLCVPCHNKLHQSRRSIAV